MFKQFIYPLILYVSWVAHFQVAREPPEPPLFWWLTFEPPVNSKFHFSYLAITYPVKVIVFLYLNSLPSNTLRLQMQTKTEKYGLETII